MSLRLSTVVAITGQVQEPAFTNEKKHMLLALVNNPLMPSTTPWIEFTNITSFGAYFGQTLPEYSQVQKYFSRLSKVGLAPEKVVIANWYQQATAPFYKGVEITTSLTDLKAVDNGSFNITFGASTFEVVVDLSSINTYSDIANLIQTALTGNSGGGEAFTNATCTYSTITGGLIITSGSTGSTATISAITSGSTGTDLSSMLGLTTAELSQGVNAETWTQFCDRIYQANSSGFAITTLYELESQDVIDSVKWLATVNNGQTYNTQVKLVFNFNSKETAENIQEQLNNAYTGYTICYDPYNEYINILNGSIGASIDFEQANSAINYNFQPADGYTPITNYGSVVDYQAGDINENLVTELNSYNINYVYSLGTGIQETIYYGKGLMAGSFRTEDVQINESWLESDIQTNVINAFDTLNKVELQGDDAEDLMTSLILLSFEKGKTNGVVARNGTLSQTSRLNIVQATNNQNAPDCVADNGYYIMINGIDIKNKRVNVVACYLCGGVVNEVRIINNVYQG